MEEACAIRASQTKELLDVLCPSRQLPLVILGDEKSSFWWCLGESWKRFQNVPFKSSKYSVCSTSKGFVVSGGCDPSGRSESRCYQYDTLLDTWEEYPRMHQARYHHGSVSFGDQLFVVGGQGDRVEGQSERDSYCASVKKLSMKSKPMYWTRVPSLPTPVSLPRVVAVSHPRRLFVAGSSYSLEVYELNLEKQEWESRSPLPAHCPFATAVAYGDQIFIVGGETKQCMSYDPFMDRWTRLMRPGYPHSYGPAAVLNDKIVVFGGREREGSEFVEQYDPEDDRWNLLGLRIAHLLSAFFVLKA